ncbi:MAG: hypothetical protein U0232_24200 [Thermomicrobiales bacterium]
MSVQFEVPVAEVVAVATLESATEMESAWRQAWEARGRAAEMGDYVAAERWHDRARELASRLDAAKQEALIASR